MSKSNRRRDILPRAGRGGAAVLTVPQQYPAFQVWTDLDDHGREIAATLVPNGTDPGLSAAHSQLVDELTDDLPDEAFDQVRQAIERVGLVSQFRERTLELLPFYMGHVLATEGEGRTVTLLRDVAPERISETLDILRERLTAWAVSDGPMRMFDDATVRADLAENSARSITANALADILIPAAHALTDAERKSRRALTDLKQRIPAEVWQVWHVEGPRLTEAHAATTVEMRSRSFAHRIAREAVFDTELVRTLWAEIVSAETGTPGKRRRRAATPARRPTTPTMLPGFHGGEVDPNTGKRRPEGTGWVPNDLTSHSAVRSFQNAGDGRWETGPDGYPYDQHAGKDWGLSYFLSPEDTASTDEAAALVGGMNDETADVYMIASAQWLANHQRDPKGGLAYLAVDQVLEQRGTAKATHRGYKSEDRARVAEHMRRLCAVWVEGSGIPGYEPNAKGKGSQRVTRRLRGKLLVVSTVDTQETLEGESRPVGYFYRLGDWARSLTGDEGAPQLAKMMQTVIALDWKHAKYPKRLGYFLTWRFRTCARQRSFAQPLTVIQLLEGAGLQVPANNPQRFRELVEAGLADLKHVGVIGDWRYAAEPTLPKYKWLERWLTEWTLVITPPAELAAEYLKISTRHRASQPPKALPKTA